MSPPRGSQSDLPQNRSDPAIGVSDNGGAMAAKEQTSYCLPCDRVVVWTTWRTWQKHLDSEDHRECVIRPRPLPPERVRPADLDNTTYGLAEGESAVLRRPDGRWIGVAALEAGAMLRVQASQRQIALERIRRLLPPDAAPTKQVCLRCRLLLDPVILGHHNTSKLHRLNMEPELEAEVAPAPQAPPTAPLQSPTDDRGVSLTMAPVALTIADAARVLGLSKSTISQLARERTIPSLRIGSRVLVPVKALQEWVDGRLREDADRYTPSWARLRDYAQSWSPGSQSRRKRGGWRS